MTEEAPAIIQVLLCSFPPNFNAFHRVFIAKGLELLPQVTSFLFNLKGSLPRLPVQSLFLADDACNAQRSLNLNLCHTENIGMHYNVPVIILTQLVVPWPVVLENATSSSSYGMGIWLET